MGRSWFTFGLILSLASDQTATQRTGRPKEKEKEEDLFRAITREPYPRARNCVKF